MVFRTMYGIAKPLVRATHITHTFLFPCCLGAAKLPATMNPPNTAHYRVQVEEFRRRHRTGLVTLVFTDMCSRGRTTITIRSRRHSYEFRPSKDCMDHFLDPKITPYLWACLKYNELIMAQFMALKASP
jgi:hypothetical protein